MPERNPWTDAGLRWGQKQAEAEERASKASGPDIGEEKTDLAEYRERLEHKGFYMNELKDIEGMKRVLAAKKGTRSK